MKLGKGAKHQVLFTGCHHAREWLSLEIPFLVAKYLIENYEDKPSGLDADDATIERKKRIKHLVDNREIWFVPLVNPDGHTWSMLADRSWRRNKRHHHVKAQTISANQYVPPGSPDAKPPRTVHIAEGDYVGVDLNRNYPTSDWGFETYNSEGDRMTSRDPAGRGWPGPEAGSEPEVRAMATLIAANRFAASISYHNYGKLLAYADLGEGAPFLQNVGQGMENLLNANLRDGFAYQYVCGDTTVPLYPITGHFGDYCFEQVPGQPTFTLELPPHEDDLLVNEWAYSGWPDKLIDAVFRENLPSALALINSAGFSQPSGPQKICVNAGTHTVQVVDDCCRVFEDFHPEESSTTDDPG